MLEKEGKYDQALLVAKKAYELDPYYPHRILDVCAPARKAGELELAVDLASVLLSELRNEGAPDGTVLTRAFYEMIYSLRLTGRIDEANSLLTDFYGNQDLYGGPNWMAWAISQKGCLLAQDIEPNPRAIHFLEEALRLFLEMGDIHKGAIIQANITTTYRALRKFDKAQNSLNTTESMRASISYNSVFENEVLTIEKAELERIKGNNDKALELFNSLSDSKSLIHTTLSLLGIGEINRKLNGRIVETERAIKLSQRIGFRFGHVHGILNLAFANELSTDDTIEKLLEIMPGKEKRQIKMFINKHSKMHVIAFPS